MRPERKWGKSYPRGSAVREISTSIITCYCFLDPIAPASCGSKGATKPFFRELFKRKRCLMPMPDYYEWQETPHGKQP